MTEDMDALFDKFLTLDGDVYVGGHMKVAWFKDPDGNILNLASR